MTDRLDNPFMITAPLVAKPWGGRRLADWGRDLPPDGTWGESWDVSDLEPDATTVSDPAGRVVGGPFDGQRLSELVASHRDDLLGDSRDLDGHFPLLVKLLDAQQHLSVQVHPPSAYVAHHPSTRLKTESWVVVDAAPGAGMWIGLDHAVTEDQLRRTADSTGVSDLLRWLPARPGAVHHLPAGVVHALGAGVMVAEVQTPSDTTFRLYDWTTEYDRAPRDLHVDEALHAMELAWEDNASPPSPLEPDDPTVSIVDTDAYRIDRHHLDADEVVPGDPGRARVVMVLEGAVSLAADEPVILDRGGVAIAPAAWDGAITTDDHATVLVVTAT